MTLAIVLCIGSSIEGNKSAGIPFGLVALSLFGLFGFLNPEHKTGRMQTWLRDKAEEKQDATIRKLSHPLTRIPIYCVTPFRDEAGLLLSSLMRTAELPFILWKPAIFITLLNIMALLFALRGGLDSVLVRLEISLGVCVLVLAGLQMLMWLIPAIVRSHSLGFGKELGMDNWLVKVYCTPHFQGVTTSQIKIGGETFTAIEKIVEADRLKRFLRKRRHSLIYSDKNTIDMIVAWIVGQEANRRDFAKT